MTDHVIPATGGGCGAPGNVIRSIVLQQRVSRHDPGGGAHRRDGKVGQALALFYGQHLHYLWKEKSSNPFLKF